MHPLIFAQFNRRNTKSPLCRTRCEQAKQQKTTKRLQTGGFSFLAFWPQSHFFDLSPKREQVYNKNICDCVFKR